MPFTDKEKKRFRMKKYLKEHIFDFVLELCINVAFTLLIVYICEGEKYWLGAILAVLYSIVKIFAEIRMYKKYYLDVIIKGDDVEKN